MKQAKKSAEKRKLNKTGGRTQCETVGTDGSSCMRLFWEFLKIGLFTIGGGMAMIPQLQQVVKDKGWLEDDEMIDCIAISQSLPGIIAINMATYIGMKLRGLRGALSATLGVVTPSFIIIILAVTVLDNIGENPYVQGAFMGVKAAVCGLIVVTVVRMGKKILRSVFAWVLAVLAFVAIAVFGINAIWAILAGAAAGIAYNAAKLRALEKAPETEKACSLEETPEAEKECTLEEVPEAEKECSLDEEVDG